MSTLINIIHERAERLQKNLYHLSESGDSISVLEKECVLADIALLESNGFIHESEQISNLLKLISIRNGILSEVLYVD